jgi:hypothetical protein
VVKLTPEQAVAVARRYPSTVEPECDGLRDLESAAFYEPRDLRDALGWIAAGEYDSDGTNPRTTRLARWWHNRGALKVLTNTDA